MSRIWTAMALLLVPAAAPAGSGKVVDESLLGVGTFVRELAPLPPDRIVSIGSYREEDGTTRGFMRVLQVDVDAPATSRPVEDPIVKGSQLLDVLPQPDGLWLVGADRTTKEGVTLRARENEGGWTFERLDALPSAFFSALATGPRGMQTAGAQTSESLRAMIVRRTYDDGETWWTVDDVLKGDQAGSRGMASSSEGMLAIGSLYSRKNAAWRWITRRSLDGIAWTTVDEMEGSANAIAADPTDPRTFYVAGTVLEGPFEPAAILRVTHDAGGSWEEVDRVKPDGEYPGGALAVHVTASGRVFWSASHRVITEDQGVIRMLDPDGAFVNFDERDGYHQALTSLSVRGGETLYAALETEIGDSGNLYRCATVAYVLDPPDAAAGGGGGGGSGAGSGGTGGNGGEVAGGSGVKGPAGQGCSCSASPPGLAVGLAALLLRRRRSRIG